MYNKQAKTHNLNTAQHEAFSKRKKNKHTHAHTPGKKEKNESNVSLTFVLCGPHLPLT